MAKTHTTKRISNQAEVEIVAPVAYRADACRMADETGLPMTVYSVVDRENCRWFQVWNVYYPESAQVREGALNISPLVTMLPNAYFSVSR